MKKRKRERFSKFDRKERVKVKDNLEEILIKEWSDIYKFKGLENVKNHLLAHIGQEVTIGNKKYIEEYETWIYRIRGCDLYVWQDDFLEKLQ